MPPLNTASTASMPQAANAAAAPVWSSRYRAVTTTSSAAANDASGPCALSSAARAAAAPALPGPCPSATTAPPIPPPPAGLTSHPSHTLRTRNETRCTSGARTTTACPALNAPPPTAPPAASTSTVLAYVAARTSPSRGSAVRALGACPASVPPADGAPPAVPSPPSTRTSTSSYARSPCRAVLGNSTVTACGSAVSRCGVVASRGPASDAVDSATGTARCAPDPSRASTAYVTDASTTTSSLADAAVEPGASAATATWNRPPRSGRSSTPPSTISWGKAVSTATVPRGAAGGAGGICTSIM